MEAPAGNILQIHCAWALLASGHNFWFHSPIHVRFLIFSWTFPLKITTNQWLVKNQHNNQPINKHLIDTLFYQLITILSKYAHHLWRISFCLNSFSNLFIHSKLYVSITWKKNLRYIITLMWEGVTHSSFKHSGGFKYGWGYSFSKFRLRNVIHIRTLVNFERHVPRHNSICIKTILPPKTNMIQPPLMSMSYTDWLYWFEFLSRQKRISSIDMKFVEERTCYGFSRWFFFNTHSIIIRP